MSRNLKQRLEKLSGCELSSLTQSRVGLEKESLRVAPSGSIAQTPHPLSLGSPLTNSYITTDFSEALMEMITPPCASVEEALAVLADIEKFVSMNIKDEFMWATSMPCVVEGGDSIPLAEYGRSNIGTMKKVYRRGLGYRYGRTMQVIAGIHFNYSFADTFWDLFAEIEGVGEADVAFRNDHYMGLIRNVLRFGWFIPYLFGASPAVCKSFLHGKRTMLSSFSEGTAYEEYATSLRMGNIGYTNSKESVAGIKADYTSLSSYIESLDCAIRTPYEEYEDIGVEVDGEYRQLNANLLQIENEYYSTVRPKQIPEPNQMPIHALRDRGIQYIELRSLDVNAFHPMGITEEQMRFLEIFMLFCLLRESPTLSKEDLVEVDINLITVAHEGRKPSVMLSRDDVPVSLKEWATEICQEMQGVAELLDDAHGTKEYSKSLQAQFDCILRPDLTPSARILREMREAGEEYFHFAKRMSLTHQDYLREREITEERVSFFRSIVEESIAEQHNIEAADDVSFTDFLRRYYEQV